MLLPTVKLVETLIVVLDVRLPAVTVPRFAVRTLSDVTLILSAVIVLEAIFAPVIVLAAI